MATTAKETGQESARAQIRAWVLERAEGSHDLDFGTLRDEAVQRFFDDQAFREMFVRESLPAAVMYEVQQAFAARRAAMNRYMRLKANAAITKEEFERRAARFAIKWSQWVEHTGARTMRLLDMKKADLRLAAERRFEQRDVHDTIGQHWLALAAGMETEEETVEQRYTEEEIEFARMQVEKEGESNGRV